MEIKWIRGLVHAANSSTRSAPFVQQSLLADWQAGGWLVVTQCHRSVHAGEAMFWSSVVEIRRVARRPFETRISTHAELPRRRQ